MCSKKNNGLKSRIFKAGSWVLVKYIASQVIRLSGNLILTRLLVPEMFGVMALVTVILMGLNLFSDIGLTQNIIQSRRGEEPKFLNTAWVVQIIRGFAISLIMLITAWILSLLIINKMLPIGSAYANPILPVVITVMSLMPLISGFQSTKLFVQNRKLRLARITVLELISQITGLIVMIAWAAIEQSIWALVVGNLVSSIVKMILSHTIIDGHPNRFEWDHGAFDEIFHFGKWIFISSIMGFLISQGDKLILGGLMTADRLGIYSIAFFLSNATLQAIVRLSGSVFFPAFSEIHRETPEKLSRIYYKIRHRVDFITYFIAGLLFFSGTTIISILYDNRYIEAGWMLQVLSFSLFVVGFLVADECFLALGKPKILVFISTVQAITLFLIVPVSFYIFGVYGAVWGVTLNMVPRIILVIAYMKKNKLLQLNKEFIMFPMFFVGCAIGYLVNVFFSTFISI